MKKYRTVQKNENPCFGRSEILISTGQHAIFLISAVEACRRSGSCSLASQRTGICPVPGTFAAMEGRIQAGTLFYVAGYRNQTTGKMILKPVNQDDKIQLSIKFL